MQNEARANGHTGGMMKTLVPMFALGGGLLFLVGCGSSRDNGFADVQKTITERTSLQVQWDQGTPEDERAHELVMELLAKEMDATAAVQVALLNNRRVQAIYADLGLAQADLMRAGLLSNPILSADARFFSGGALAVDLSLMQSVLDLLAMPLRKRLAASAFAAAKLRVAGAVLALTQEVRVAFVRMQTATQILEMRRTITEASAIATDLSRRLREAGNITALDFAQERNLFEQAKLDLAAAEVDVAAQREGMNILLGVWGPQSATWRAAGHLPDMPVEELPLEDLETRVVAANMRLAVAREEIAIHAQRLGVSQSFAIAGDAQVGVSAERETDGAWGVGPAISIPLPLFSQGQATIATARAELRRSEQMFVADAITLRALARIARARLLAARDRVAYFRTVMLPLRQDILDEMQKQYNGMLASAFQLILAKQQQIDGGAQYIAALGAYWNARASLELLLMGGTGHEETAMETFSLMTQPADQDARK